MKRKTVFIGTLLLMTAVGLMAAQLVLAQYGEYPVPGRQEGTVSFFNEKDAAKLANKNYPSWYRGNGPNGAADENSRYFYTQLVGPSAYTFTGLNANNLQFGTLVLKPGETYPAHNHPSPEIYYITEGEADWYIDDQKEHVTVGATMFHRPYAVHGWVNTSKTQPLKVVWIWWTEGNMTPADLDKGARFVNPDLVKEPGTIKPYAVPLPPVRKGN